jgi:hypothetical protein
MKMLETIKAKLFQDDVFCDRKIRTLTTSEIDFLLKETGLINPTEALYWLVNSLTNYPRMCLNCGNPSKFFKSFNKGYTRDYCCLTCSNGSKTVKEKKKQTSQKNYGTDFPWQHETIKKKISQIKATS